MCFNNCSLNNKSDEPEHLPFDPPTTCEVEYPITTYQPKYFVTESFEDAKYKLKEFAKVSILFKRVY